MQRKKLIDDYYVRTSTKTWIWQNSGLWKEAIKFLVIGAYASFSYFKRWSCQLSQILLERLMAPLNVSLMVE